MTSMPQLNMNNLLRKKTQSIFSSFSFPQETEPHHLMEKGKGATEMVHYSRDQSSYR